MKTVPNVMPLEQSIEKASVEAINYFHHLINQGIDIERARTLALKNTCMTKAINYIKAY